ncbi:MAG: GNAT family N-acetyltransferase, partial [Candidatus Marinimicrobia bacterium]|nr:GNAT family N-acetyltransferase [Candidatus Neomarinimicrobiota bacterium]
IFKKKGQIIALFPAAERILDGEKVLHSHPGASYGGFVFEKLGYGDADEILELFESYCRKQGFQRVFYIPTPALYFKHYDETMEYAQLWKKYTVVEDYISSFIDLSGDQEDVFNRMDKRKRRYVRRLQKDPDIRLEWNKNYDEYYPILVCNKAKHKVTPTHSLDELKKLDRLFPGQLNLLMCYYKDKPIGGTLNFTANSRVVIIFYNMIDDNYQELQPASLQIWETMRWAHGAGFKYLDFGVSQLPLAENPLTPSKSLILFKEHFGSRNMIRKAMEKRF